MVWACAVLRTAPVALVGEVRARPQALGPQSCANALWALSQLREPLQPLARRATELPLLPQHLANSFAACLATGELSEQLLSPALLRRAAADFAARRPGIAL